MNTPPPRPRRKLRVRWILGAICLLFAGWFFFQLFGPAPAIIVSKETTFITEPLTEDGLPDYELYCLQQSSQGVTPENNAAVLIWQAMWPGELAQEHQLPMCNALGMKEVPSEQEALVPVYSLAVREQLVPELLERFPKPNEQHTEEETGDGIEFEGYQDWETRLRNTTADELIGEASARPWTSEQIPGLASWITQNQKPLDLLVEASRRPRFYSPLLYNESKILFLHLLPELPTMRSAIPALRLRAMWHLGEGRTKQAWQDLQACHRLARLTSNNFLLVGQVIAISIDGDVHNGTRQFLHHSDLSLEDARQVLNDINALGKPSSIIKSLDEYERIFLLDVVFSLMKGRPEVTTLWEGVEIPDRWLMSLNGRVDWNLILIEINTWFDNLINAVKLPTRKQRYAEFDRVGREFSVLAAKSGSLVEKIHGALSRRQRSKSVGTLLLALLCPNASAAFKAEDRCNTQLELTSLAAALAVYRAEHGEYPEQLENLVPAVIPQLPLDLYSNQPFLYRRTDDGGYLLYSLFENEIDDGGTDMSGDVIQGQWVEETPADFSYEESDLVIRVPMPPFKFPPPPSVEDYGGMRGYGE